MSNVLNVSPHSLSIFLRSHRYLSSFHICLELHLLQYLLQLHSHEISFTNNFNSHIPVIILNTFTFAFSVLFRIHHSSIGHE